MHFSIIYFTVQLRKRKIECKGNLTGSFWAQLSHFLESCSRPLLPHCLVFPKAVQAIEKELSQLEG